jgi:hypothetical protein
MKLSFKGRKVEINIAGSYDEPFAETGNYIDGAMEDLSEDELDEIQDLYAGEISQELMEHAMNRAHEMAEGDR